MSKSLILYIFYIVFLSAVVYFFPKLNIINPPINSNSKFEMVTVRKDSLISKLNRLDNLESRFIYKNDSLSIETQNGNYKSKACFFKNYKFSFDTVYIPKTEFEILIKIIR